MLICEKVYRKRFTCRHPTFVQSHRLCTEQTEKKLYRTGSGRITANPDITRFAASSGRLLGRTFRQREVSPTIQPERRLTDEPSNHHNCDSPLKLGT